MNITQVRQLINSELTSLYTHSELRVITRALIEDLLQMKLSNSFEDAILNEEQVGLIRVAIERLLNEEPIQYVTAKAHFFNLVFEVNPSVLIPRPETEELVEWVLEELKYLQKIKSRPYSIIDLGTGSGCIAIALKKNIPELYVRAVDISDDSLQVAKRNASTHQVEIHFIHEDIKMLQMSDKDIDVIVSNPPYIPESEAKSLHRRVTSFEPHQALFEPDDEPLKFYQEIIRFSDNYLTKSGLIFVELHQDYALQTAALFEKHFYKVVLRKDISGNNRMLMAAHLKGNQR